MARIRSKTNRKNKSQGSEGFHGSDSKDLRPFQLYALRKIILKRSVPTVFSLPSLHMWDS